MKPLVYEWDHERQRYVTPGDRVECLKERVMAADDYVAEVERLTAELKRVTGPREPPHCPTCDCPGPSPGVGT